MEGKMNVRTRKAIEREMKKEKKAAIKRETKRFLKTAIKIAVILLVAYVLFVVMELVRFNKNLGVLPGKITGEEYTEDTAIYSGIGYTISYKYDKKFEEYQYSANSLTNDNIVSGEFKLFNKWLLGAWIK